MYKLENPVESEHAVTKATRNSEARLQEAWSQDRSSSINEEGCATSMGEVEAKATKTEKKQTVAQLLKFYVTFVAASVGGWIVYC